MRTKAQRCLLFSLAPVLGLVLFSCQKKASVSGTSFADGAKTTATKAEKTPPQKILALKELMSTLGIQNPKRDMAAVTDNELDLLTELLLAARNKSAKERAEIVSSVKYILNAAPGDFEKQVLAAHSRLLGGTKSVGSNSGVDSTRIAPPSIGAAAGEQPVGTLVTLSHALGAEVDIRYTLDDSKPGKESLLYTQPLILGSGTITLRAVAIRSTGEVSDETVKVFKGISSCGSLANGTSETRVRYQSATVEWGSTCVSESQSRTCSDGTLEGWTGQFAFESCLVKASVPLSSLAAGGYQSNQSVSLSAVTPGASLLYSLDGSDPSGPSGLAYTTPFSLGETEGTVTLKAVTRASGYGDSPVQSWTFQFDHENVSSPQFSLAAGTYQTAQSVSLTGVPSGTVIRYSLDGTTPSEASLLYETPLSLADEGATTIKAKAWLPGLMPSVESSRTFVVDLNNPVTGGGGTLSIGDVLSTSATLSWTQASDTVTTNPSLLSYRVVSGAASADINSAEEIEAQSGGTLVADWSQGITSQELSGATPGSSRWFAVGVRDEAGRVSAYTPRKIDFPPNVPALPQGESLSKYAIQVSFTPATGAQSYSILHRENQIDAPQSFSCAASPCVLSGLSPGSTRFFRVVAVSAAGAQSAPSAEIQVSTPAVLTRHTVFLTSTQHTGNLGGAAGADAICQTRAEAAGLAGLWKAVLNVANGQSTDERIVIEAHLYDAKPDAPGPQLIAANANDFWTAMSVAPRYTELGVHLPDVEDEGHNTWTGRATSDNCLGFTSESSGDSGEVGSSFALLQNWGTESVFRCGTEACNTARRLMCINQ